MLRKLVLALLTAGSVALTPAIVSADPPVEIQRYRHDRGHDRHHRVLYQVQIRFPGRWEVYGTYRDRDEALRVGRWLEATGRDAQVVPVWVW